MRHYLFTLGPLLMVAVGAALEPCERVWAFLKAWERANLRAGFGRKQMAGYMGVSEPQLSMQLSLVNNQHPSMARAALAPNIVHLYYAQEICDMDGTARVMTDATVGRLIHCVEMLDIHLTKAEFTAPKEERRRA